MDEYWGMSLDDLAEQIHDLESDAIGGHYVAFSGTKAEARQKLIDAFARLVDKHMYRANSYGSKWHEGDEGNE